MLRLPSFAFHAPKTVEEAAALLAEDPAGTKLVAGGTDLWPNLKRRHQSAKTVVSLRRIEAMHGICETPGGGLAIGATTTLDEITRDARVRERYPALVTAVASISSPVLRNTGTIGGNLCLDTRCTYYNQNEEWRRSIGYCMKEVGSTCWVAPGSPRCWAISASDSAPPLCAIGARVKLVSKDGERMIPLHDLYNDDGIAYLTKRRDEILTELVLPPAAGFKSTYWKLRRRGSIDFPVLGVGAAVWTDDDGTVTDARVYLGAVSSFPVLAEETSKSLIGQKLTDETIAAAAVLARKPATPLDNTDFVVNWRKQMAQRYVEGALRELAGLPPKVKIPEHGRGVA